MLRIGSDQPGQPPDQMPPPDAGAPPQPDAPPDMGQGGDHAQQLVQALTHLRLAMELIIGCLSQYGGGDEPPPPDAGPDGPPPAEGADEQVAP